MKKMNLKTMVLLMASLLFIGTTQIKAQKGQMKGNKAQGWVCNIPDLTDDQQKKIDDLRVEHQKIMLNNRNQMMEKRAKLNTLRTADKADMNAINKLIDEMGVLHTQMMKDKEAHHQAIRSLLNDKQRVFFDSHKGRGFGEGRGSGQGMGRGYNRMGNDCPRR
ncbi:MAG: Spy/CpxP family protein refolding chaperone [Chloroflexia bacterium]|nr:Spy/CpxP family protein refolding chaperone [Chloroflexia bacterium]